MTPEDVRNAVAGDLAAFKTVAAQPHERLTSCCNELPEGLVVTAAGVRRVLLGLQSGEIAPDVAQEWASFVRRGYISGPSVDPLFPVQIEYDNADEEILAEAISRMDELGDIVDGTISDSEMTELLARLNKAS